MAKIEKLSDDVFNGSHPNGINKGYTKEIAEAPARKPIVGEPYYFGSLRTSYVTEILTDSPEKMIFKTENSTYCVTY